MEEKNIKKYQGTSQLKQEIVVRKAYGKPRKYKKVLIIKANNYNNTLANKKIYPYYKDLRCKNKRIWHNKERTF